MHIHTPLYKYAERYGGNEGDLYVGLNKDQVDERAKLKGVIDIIVGNNPRIRAVLAKDIQGCPVEVIPGYLTKVYIFKL